VCSLAWTAPPQAATVNALISSAEFAGGPPAPGVTFFDGAMRPVSGRAVTVTLGPSAGVGTLSGSPLVATTNAVGVAEFTTARISATGSYRLSATAPGVAGAAVTQAFPIQTQALACATTGCSDSLSGASSSVSVAVDAGGATGFLSLSVNRASGAFAPDCSPYYDSVAGDWAVVLGPDRTKTIEFRVAKADMNRLPQNGAAHLEVCYGAPVPSTFDPGDPATWPFTVQPGTLPKRWDFDGDGIQESAIWLLADCSATSGRPCLAALNKNGRGDGIATVLAPAGADDPAMRP